MNATTATLLRSILKIGAGYLAGKGLMDDATGEIIIAGLIALLAVIWGIVQRKPEKPIVQNQIGKTMPLLLIAIAIFGAACRNLEPGGPYQSDAVLFQAEFTTVTAHNVISTFVRWEYENRAALATWPEIKSAADKMRRGAPEWFKTAYALRDAYATAPTTENRAALEKIIATLRTALLEASGYLATVNSVNP